MNMIEAPRRRILESVYSTGPREMGGHNYTELVVRDSRNKIVGYGLVCQDDETHDDQLAELYAELKNDLLR